MGNSHPNIHKPQRILAIEHGKISVEIINHLRDIYKVKNTHFIHIGGRNADMNITSLLKLSNAKSKTGHIMEGDRFSGAASVLVTSKWFDEAKMTGVDHLQRRSEEFKYNHHHISGFHECQHYYHIVVDVLANILLRERIDLVLFFDIPHLFYDTLLYQVAKSRGIETLIFKQSIFPNLYYSLRTVVACGNLPPFPTNQFVEPLTINPEETPDWYYMRGIGQEHDEFGHLTMRALFQLFTFLLTQNPLKLLQPLYIFKLIRRMRRISSAFPKWRDPFASFFHVKHLMYFEFLMEFENGEIDMNRKFVYFPLQLQPELTTASLGGRYSDQVLAIELLAQMIPDDCLIYVKENPKQTGRMRGAIYFHRLRRIHNVRLLPSYANTHELTDRAVFVATVTGTVGWEAVCQGKTVLVFGMPWYRNMPGVVDYRKKLKFEDVCNLTFNHSELERHAGWLIARFHSGVISRIASRQIDDFDSVSNTKLVANSISNLIEGQIETTFI